MITFSQTVFTIFFAIVWGTIANVLPKWKPFHWTLVPLSFRVAARAIFSFLMFNIVPLIIFLRVMFRLGKINTNNLVNDMSGLRSIILPAAIPCISIFGLYRIWIGIVELIPKAFYYECDQDKKMPEKIRILKIDPTIEGLHLHKRFVWSNLLFGSIYMLTLLVPYLWLHA